jgi:hypothetical protein
MCPTPQLVKLLSALIGGGFILYGTYSLITGTHHDSDEGPVDQSAHPVRFYVHVIGIYLLGLLIIAVGFQTKAAGFVISLLNRITK